MKFIRCYVALLIIVTIVSAVATIITDVSTIPEAPEQTEEVLEVSINEEKCETESVIMNTEPKNLPILKSIEYVEKYSEVPHFYQTDYPNTPYGKYGTVASHGCGIASLAMVLTYMTDEETLPDYLASKYGHYNTESGSSYMLFPDSAKDYGITIEMTYAWSDAVIALKNGQVIIALAHGNSVFTDGGHFIVLCGITDDSRIIVKDPNRWNYKIGNSILNDGYANGFDEKYIKSGCYPFWIYEPKDLEALATQIEYNTPIEFDIV